jgi:putative transposon-encoded protein
MLLSGKKGKLENRKVLKTVTEAIVDGNITAKRNILQNAAFGNSVKMNIPKRILDWLSLITSQHRQSLIKAHI